MRQLQDVTCEESEECAAQGSCHAADTDHCAHGAAGEHVRRCCEEIGGPALVCASGDTDQSDGAPQRLDSGGREDGKNQRSTDEHGSKTCIVGRESEASEGCGQPASADTADRRNVIDENEWQTEVREVQIEFRAEVRRQPE